MGIINYIEFGGVKSSDYGIYVSGEGTFNAPERDVELIEIPGRNGDFSLDKGRFKNITVTYPVFNYETNLTDFRTRLSDFRNALKSKIGYQRLEDSFHPDEYRMATFIDVFEVQPVMYNTASTIELTFNCKPQRFLKSGEIPQTIGEWSETQTASGSIATFEAESNTGIKSLMAEINPIQSGSGEPSPSNVRPISGWGSVKVTECGKNILYLPTLEEFQACPIVGNYHSYAFKVKPNTSYHLSVSYTDGYDPSGKYVYFLLTNNPTSNNPWIALAHHTSSPGGTITSSSDGWLYLRLNNNDNANTHYPAIRSHAQAQLEEGTTATDYEPYQGETITKSLGRTVYGGTLDLISGVLTVTKKALDLGSVNWTKSNTSTGHWWFSYTTGDAKSGASSVSIPNIISTNYKAISPDTAWGGTQGITINNANTNLLVVDSAYSDASSFKTAMSGVIAVYPLATPLTYQLTPEQIETLLGVNNIWADSGEVSVEYGADPNDAYNPTPFSSRPLIETEGHGLISINGQNVNILPAKPLGYIPLWVGTRPPENIGESIYLDFSKFNTGDKFYLSAIYSVNYYALEYLKTTQGTGTSSNADFIVNNATISFEDDILRFDALTPEDIEFTIGTEKTVTTTFTINTTNPTLTISIPFSIHYIPSQNVITLGADTEEATSGVSGSVEGYSSVVIEATTYIDCEIGEAYYLEDGEVISANNSVSLPAILPELKAGNNPITHDDTITELKITPGYWKI